MRFLRISRLAILAVALLSLTSCQALGGALKSILTLPINLVNGLSRGAGNLGRGGGGFGDASSSLESPASRGSTIENRGDYRPQATPSILEVNRVAARNSADIR